MTETVTIHERMGGDRIELRRDTGGQYAARPVRFVDTRTVDGADLGGHCISHHEDHVTIAAAEGWTIAPEGDGEYELADHYGVTACPQCLGGYGDVPKPGDVQTFLEGYWDRIRRELRDVFERQAPVDTAAKLVELDDEVHKLREVVADLQDQIDDLKRRTVTHGEKRPIRRANDLGDRS